MLLGLMAGVLLGLLVAHLHRPRRRAGSPAARRQGVFFPSRLRWAPRTHDDIHQELTSVAGAVALRMLKEKLHDAASDKELERFLRAVISVTVHKTCEMMAQRPIFTAPSRN